MNYEVRHIFGKNETFFDASGFPDMPVINSLENRISKSPVYRWSRTEKSPGRRVVSLGYANEYLPERQAFFAKIMSRKLPEFDIFDAFDDYLGEHHFKRLPDYTRLFEDTGEIVAGLRKQLGGFKDIPEAKRVLDKLENCGHNFERLRSLSVSAPDIRYVLLDLREGSAFPYTGCMNDPTDRGLPELLYRHIGRELGPEIHSFREIIAERSSEFVTQLEARLKEETQKSYRDLHGKLDYALKEAVRNYVETEFSVDADQNLRHDYETLLVPFMAMERYNRFLGACKKCNSRRISEEYGGEFYEDELLEDDGLYEELGLIPGPVFPEFGERYEIQGLYSPRLMSMYPVQMGEFTPIDFETKDGERLFYVTGLNSGGKSFFVESLIGASLIGQLGLPLLAKELKFPLYDRISYHKAEQSDTGGRFENEIRGLKRIVRYAREGDLVVVDEMLSSTGSQNAEHLTPVILRDLEKSGATVFVVSHVTVDYDSLEDSGWTLLSPEAEIIGGRVRPKHTLVKARPDRRILEQYAKQVYRET